jgi:hypothetical protein
VRALQGVIRRAAREGAAAGSGAGDDSAQDRSRHRSGVEERRGFYAGEVMKKAA